MTSSTSYSSIAHRNGAVKVTTESVGVLRRDGAVKETVPLLTQA